MSEREYLYRSLYRYELETVPYSLLTSPAPVPPAISTAGISMAWRRRQYDLDGRLLAEDVIKRDTTTSALPFPWSTAATTVVSSQTWAYNGYSVTITDAAGKTRTETRDALGRLTAVAQPGSATAVYGYPARQMTVTQTDSATQSRTFTYTSLGRLASAVNPESGTSSYTHYAGGQLWTKTGGNAVVTTLTYDGAQRVLTKSYNDGTPAVRYCYDGERYLSGNCVADASSRGVDGGDFPKGQLTGYGNLVAATNYERVDALGRVTQVRQSVDGLAGDAVISYTYGSGGVRKSMTYPSGRVVSYSLGDTGKAIQLSGTFAGGGATYASATQYAPSGSVLSSNLAGSSLLEKRTYNELGQATQIEVMRGLQLIHRLRYWYPAVGNNGNVSSHSIATPQRTWNQYFGYDGANRLRLAMERSAGAPADPSFGSCSGTQSAWTGGEWCQRFGFDGFGNAWSAENFGATPLVANGASWYVGSTNRYLLNGLNGGGYDGAGNQTQLQVNDPQLVTDYDGEGRVLRRRNTQLGTTLFEYGYGGGGQRVRKLVGTVATRYEYGADGELVAEYGAAGTSGSASPEYVLTDGLGSTRTKTNGVGLALATFDYEPFGAEIVRNGSGGDGLRQRYTGKERDAETGLDYFGARYMSAAQGRFTSADAPFADQKPEGPQSWNLYSYVRNNPLRYTDPTGRCLYPGADCFQYLVGGAKEVANLPSDAATLLNRGINALTGATIADAPRFEGTNFDQRAGMAAADFVMIFTPLAEAGAARIPSAASGATKVAELAGTGAKVEASITSIAPKLGEAGGPGAGEAFPSAVKDVARTESSNACVFCGQSTQRTAGPVQSNIDHAIPKSRGGNNTLNNTQNTCRTCKLDNGTRTTQEYQEEIRRRTGGN